MQFRFVGFTAIVLCAVLCLPAALQAQTAIKLGMSAPFSGPAAALGQQFSYGANLVFAAQNAQGGIGGRPIQLLTADDGYEPLRTVGKHTQLLVKSARLCTIWLCRYANVQRRAASIT